MLVYLDYVSSQGKANRGGVSRYDRSKKGAFEQYYNPYLGV